MKIRMGFVSNSSSSSFIVLGIKVEGDMEKKLAEKIKGSTVKEDDATDILWESNDYVSDDGPGYYGKVLANPGCDGELDYGCIDIPGLVPEVLKMVEFLGLTEKDIKLHFGTRSC